MVNCVLEFNKSFRVGDKKRELYMTLIEEEFNEWLEEAYATKKAPDKELKELCDLLYVIFGYSIQRGWDIVTAFNRVHSSNMSKLDSEGRPIFNDAGKVCKGPNYKIPNLKDLVDERS
jgi:predicted HAD superfamily Cof-like phosphohydrolase